MALQGALQSKPRHTHNIGKRTAEMKFSNVVPPGSPVQINPATQLPELVVELASSPEADYPPPTDGRLGNYGQNAWIGIVKLLKHRGIMSNDWYEPLMTMCVMIDTVTRLEAGFKDWVLVTNTQTGNIKANPALMEWSKLVALLRGYYCDFGLTPTTIRLATGGKTANGRSGVVTRSDLALEFESSIPIPQKPKETWMTDEDVERAAE